MVFLIIAFFSCNYASFRSHSIVFVADVVLSKQKKSTGTMLVFTKINRILIRLSFMARNFG